VKGKHGDAMLLYHKCLWL